MKGELRGGGEGGEESESVWRVRTKGRYIHSLLSFPSIFKCSYNKGFDEAQKQAAVLNA